MLQMEEKIRSFATEAGARAYVKSLLQRNISCYRVSDPFLLELIKYDPDYEEKMREAGKGAFVKYYRNAHHHLYVGHFDMHRDRQMIRTGKGRLSWNKAIKVIRKK